MNHHALSIAIVSAALCSGALGGEHHAVQGDRVAVQGAAEDPAEVDFGTLDRWLRTVADDLAAAERPGEGAVEDIGGNGTWRFLAFGQPVLVIASEAAGRVRIISPVIGEDGGPVRPDEAAMRRVLEANFSSALDARYVLHRDELWSAYLHPLGSLNEEQFRSGLQQVLNLGLTYGTSYTSSGLKFGGGEDGEGDAADEQERPGQVI